jgi:hypothetical protein
MSDLTDEDLGDPAASEGDAGDMHIHRPRAFHGWGEFLKEYGIIVLGVLTALGLEQVVESVHQREAARAATDNIRAEIQADITSLARRNRNEPCVSRRLDEISAALADPALLGAGPVWVGHPYYATLADDQFRSAEQAGHASLLPREEQAQYARIHAYFAQFMEAQAEERRAWADLRVLEQRPALTPVADWPLRSALQQARTTRWMMEVTSNVAIEAAAKLGLGPTLLKPWPLQSACLPFHTARAVGLAQVAAGRPGHTAYDEP